MALTETATLTTPAALQPHTHSTGPAARLLNLLLLAAIVCALVLLGIAWSVEREAGALLQQAEGLSSLEATPLKQRARELTELAARWKEFSGLFAVAGMLAAVLGSEGMRPTK